MSEDESTVDGGKRKRSTRRLLGGTAEQGADVRQFPSGEKADDIAPDPRTAIFVAPGRLHEAVEHSEKALVDSGLPVFHRDGQLVKVIGIDAPDAHIPKRNRKGVKRLAGAPQIVPVEGAHLAAMLSSVAQFFKPVRSKDGDQRWTPIDPPARLVDALIANPESKARPLVAFVEAPLVTPDGKIPEKVGYIEEHGLLLTGLPLNWHLHRPTTKPHRRAVEEAVATLKNTLATFPAEDHCDRSAAIALILSGLQRRVLTACPIFGIGAPTPGTGKSLLADVVSIICTGRPAAVMSIGDDAAELEKRFGAVLIAGDGFINIDNVSVPLKSDLLCSIATQPEVLIRVLGVSKRAKITTKTTVVITGNNLVVRGDLTRRVVPIRLNARVEQPEKREFDHDARAFALEHRAALVAAAMTIICGYIDAGRPKVDAPPYGSFDDWDRMVRRPLIWAGLPDPLAAVQGLRESDPDLEAHSALLQAWHEQFGARVVSAHDAVNEAVNRYAEGDREAGRLVHPQLHEAMTLAVAKRAGTITSNGLGYYLRQHVDRPVDGLVFRRDSIKKGIAQWRVERVS